MNKVIAINLGGNAYQLEEDGYESLRIYLENAAASLRGNPDRDEIMSDIEQAIAEKFRARLAGHKTVVETAAVASVLAEMGPIAAEAGEPAANPGPTGGTGPGAAKSAEPPRPEWPARRLYRVPAGAMFAGVCNGIGAYLNLDPTFVRLAFVFLTIMGGTGLLVYVVLAFVVPEAHSPEERAAASGDPLNAQEFIRRAKEGYYSAMKGFPDRRARRDYRRRFQHDLRTKADQWRFNWHRHWTGCSPAPAAPSLALPLFSLLKGIVTVLWICALTSLLATGAIFGVALPANVPVWFAALLLTLVYSLVAGPLKAARRACHWGLGCPDHTWAFAYLMEAAIGVAMTVVLLWLAILHFPQLREAIQSVPSLVQQAAGDLHNWWHHR